MRPRGVRPRPGTANPVITGNHQAAFEPILAQLDTDPRTRGVPGPILGLDGRGDFTRRIPTYAVVAAAGDVHAIIVTCEGQPDPPCVAIHDRTGIADRDFLRAANFEYQLQRTPGSAPVGTASQDQVHITVIGPAGFATFTKRQQRPVGRHQQGRYAIGVVAAAAALKHIDRPQIIRRTSGGQGRSTEAGDHHYPGPASRSSSRSQHAILRIGKQRNRQTAKSANSGANSPIVQRHQSRDGTVFRYSMGQPFCRLSTTSGACPFNSASTASTT